MESIIDIRKDVFFPKFKKRFIAFLPKNYQDDEMFDLCWNWTGCRNDNNYGLIGYRGERCYAHRMSYIIFKGPIALNKIIRHTCDNRHCVNPNHLILGTKYDNSIDSVKRNRQGHQKLNEEAVKVIKWMLKYKNKYGLASKLARLYGVSANAIYEIKKGRCWTWIKI